MFTTKDRMDNYKTAKENDMKRIGTLIMAAVFVFLGVGIESTQALIPGVPAIGYDTYTEGSTAGQDVTVGWQFTITSPVAITGLGYYDYASDGLLSNHDVGIFDTSGNLL